MSGKSRSISISHGNKHDESYEKKEKDRYGIREYLFPDIDPNGFPILLSNLKKLYKGCLITISTRIFLIYYSLSLFVYDKKIDK